MGVLERHESAAREEGPRKFLNNGLLKKSMKQGKSLREKALNISWRAARRGPKSSDWRKGRVAEGREGGRRIGREERGGEGDGDGRDEKTGGKRSRS